ncbi:replication protein C, IncQ-type [Janthinobacterium sp. SUN176]|uniref:replication protein C, IncQ-type n=1 Tax=Janthinobacterium sp. SUN176 TaxID=3014788 RepID=UPI0027131239|nr:replication protein C, IncQ-type [Janthinobacterium sp. SUN176]MDO8072836.1 replication protein C, IncQ-type [Janthinobacterium sp. SUN176]
MITTPIFAKMSPAIVHTPGLFASCAKVSLPDPTVLNHIMGGVMFRFTGPQLGPVELRVLQGLVGFAGLQCPNSRATCEDNPPEDLQRLLCHRAVVRTTTNKLAEVIGYRANSGSAQTSIRRAVQKLASVSISIRQTNLLDTSDMSAGNMISANASSRHIDVELGSILAAAIHGGRGTYLRLDIPETRKLHSDAARLLHHRLHWINTGSTRDVSLHKMIGYVWSDEEVSDSAQRTRRQVLRRSLSELVSSGWSVAERGDLYQIGRPRI